VYPRPPIPPELARKPLSNRARPPGVDEVSTLAPLLPEVVVPLDVSRQALRLACRSCLVLLAAAQPLPAQEPIRLAPRPVTITPAFAPEELPRPREDEDAVPLATLTADGER
jgi:hypothetical protein